MTPSDYAATGGGSPVVCLHHGIRETETNWHSKRNIVGLIDSLVEAGYLPPLVVVMPYGFVRDQERADRRMPDRVEFDGALVETIDEVANSYKGISRSPRQRAIAGISMGGKQAIEFGLAHPEQFSVIGALSAAIQGSSLPETFPVLGDPPKQHRLAAPNEAFATVLRQAGVDCDTSIEDGHHDWDFWSSQLPVLFTSGATLEPAIALRSLLRSILMTIHLGQRETKSSPDSAAGKVRLLLANPAGWSDEKYEEVLSSCERGLPQGIGEPASTPASDWREIRTRWAEVGLARGDEDVRHLYAGFLDACEDLLAASVGLDGDRAIDVSLPMPAAHWHVAQALTGSTLTGEPWKSSVPGYMRRKWVDDVPVVLLRGRATQLLESLRATRASLVGAFGAGF